MFGETLLFSPKAGERLAIFVKVVLIAPKLGNLRYFHQFKIQFKKLAIHLTVLTPI
jgi:hypothetical protein